MHKADKTRINGMIFFNIIKNKFARIFVLMKMKFFLIAILTCLIFIKCNKNESESNIPFVAVNETLAINSPSNFRLQAIGGWQYAFGGSKGLIIYRVSEGQFKVYDRHSPYQVDKGCVLGVDDSKRIIIDPCSESQFELSSGTILRGPAVNGLKEYRASFNGAILTISN